MIYITIPDLLAKVHDEELSNVLDLPIDEVNTGLTSDILDYSEQVGCDMVRAYLSGRWDMEVEFSKTGSTRDYFIVNNVMNILIKNLYERLSANSIPSHVTEAYTATLESLRDIQQQKYNPKIEQKSDDDETKVMRVYSDSYTKTTFDY